MITRKQLLEAQKKNATMAFSSVLIPKMPSTKVRNMSKRRMVLAIEAAAIHKKFDPSKFVNITTGKPLGVKSDEGVWRLIE
ncbi:hypothetical protein [Cohnella sp.]|uniref:hypothetical protein n=1 Tax=Cohnella sp. TaxID=1883426 RepID=UPI00356AAC78